MYHCTATNNYRRASIPVMNSFRHFDKAWRRKDLGESSGGGGGELKKIFTQGNSKAVHTDVSQPIASGLLSGGGVHGKCDIKGAVTVHIANTKITRFCVIIRQLGMRKK